MKKLYYNFKFGVAVLEEELLVDFTLEDIQEFINEGILAEIKLHEGIHYAI